jgi:hypothetical protein
LFDVFNLGTGRGLRIEGIDICGKTGTAENFAKSGGKKFSARPLHICGIHLRTIQKSQLLYPCRKWRLWAAITGQ